MMFNNGLPASNSSDMRLNKIAGCFAGALAEAAINPVNYGITNPSPPLRILLFHLDLFMHHRLFYSRRPRERALRAAQRARFPWGQWAPREGVPASARGAGCERHHRRTPFASSLIFLAYLKSRAKATAREGGRSKRGYGSSEMPGVRLHPAVDWELDHGDWSQANEITGRRRAKGARHGSAPRRGDSCVAATVVGVPGVLVSKGHAKGLGTSSMIVQDGKIKPG